MKKARRGAGYLFLRLVKSASKHILLVVAALVSIYPVIWVVSTAFTPGQSLAVGWHLLLGIFPIPNNPTLQHLSFVLGWFQFDTWLKNSGIITLSTVAVSLAITLPASYVLSRRLFPGRSEIMFSFLLPTMFPGVVTIIPLFLIFAELHLVNTYQGLIIAYAVGSLSLSIFIMKNAFDSVPKELDEAAKIDGAGDLRVFWQILIPLTLPSIATVSLWAFMGAWLDFALAHVMLTDNNLWTLPLALYSFIQPNYTEYGTFAALSLIMAIPVFIVFMLFQRYLVSGLTAGSVKG